ncbi:MAG TPA: hypothetical protein PKC19_23850, partial [Roseiflexaceae bacterium]|nr:hypothetical protein [Roseiflexaceae bacterium]
DAAARYVTHILASYQRRVAEAWGALEQALPPDGGDPVRRRWDAFWQAHTRGDALATETERRVRAGATGPLADLVRLWCVCQDAAADLTDRERWAAQAELALMLPIEGGF